MRSRLLLVVFAGLCGLTLPAANIALALRRQKYAASALCGFLVTLCLIIVGYLPSSNAANLSSGFEPAWTIKLPTVAVDHHQIAAVSVAASMLVYLVARVVLLRECWPILIVLHSLAMALSWGWDRRTFKNLNLFVPAI